MFRKLIRFIFCKLLFDVKYINSNLESNMKSCVVCSNHLSASDPFFLYADSKNLSIMAKAELFTFKPFGYILKKFGVFPIKRGEKDAKSIIHAVNILKKDEDSKLLIFPEGTRIKDGRRIPGKIGAVYVAMKAEVPILPVRIIKEDPKKTFFTKVWVIYDDPIVLDKSKIKDKEYLKKSTNDLLDRIYSLDKPKDQMHDKKNNPNKRAVKVKIQK